MVVWAKVTFQIDGLHHWPDATPTVAYLQHPHRHMFHITVWVEQMHNNRDIEYIQLKHELKERLQISPVRDFGEMSCEMIATTLAQQLQHDFRMRDVGVGRGRKVRVEVSEDGENGAVVET